MTLKPKKRRGLVGVIIWLYFLLLALSVVFIIFGFIADISIFHFAGTTMLVLLGFTLLQEGVTYKVGENVTAIVDGNVTTQIVDDTYQTYDDASGNRYGWILILVGILGFLYGLYDL